ncbi:MAG: short-chain dehydrogenase [Burkholderiales bacterium PBB5]|nr:MAG: short-chain dehydrogenase [Burkholderiales bacterium PBB5]
MVQPGGAANVEAAADSEHFPLPGWPLFRLGFRPFYLGAAIFAMLAIPYWIAGISGWVALPSTMPPLLWHAHEMLFGFAVAVIVGFLLTASMAGLWLAARLSAVWAPYMVYALLDMVLLPWVAVVLIRVLLKAGNRRNLPLGAILMLLATANLAFHAAAMQWLTIDPLRTLHAGLALVVMIECVIAGRVIPAFTMSALPGQKLQAPPWLERSTLAATALSLAAWVLLPANRVTAAGLFAAALLHAARLWHWKPWRTRARPILWVLHAAYAWLPVGFMLLAWSQAGGVAASAGIHALAVGATAAVARVLLPLVAPAHTAAWLMVAAAAWSTAFALYLWTFTPWLLSSRLDGKDG